MRNICVNTRVLAARIAGVQRYTLALLSRFGDRITQVSPEGRLDGVKGHLWEQFLLPTKLGGQLLWSPSNTGPLVVKRQVVTIHDATTLDHPEWFDPKFAAWYQLLITRLMRKVLRVITDSEFSRARLIEHGKVPEEKVVAIPLGVDSCFMPASQDAFEELRHRMSLPGAYVLVVGSLEPRKNLRRLFAAWEILRRRIQGVELVVAGSGAKVFRNTGFDRPPAGVRLVGHVSERDLPTLYSGALLFAYVSLYEGFGLPPLEAMACGTPVVASSTSSLPEVVGDAAVLVDPYDVDAIASEIHRVVEDSTLREELRRKGLERAKGFTWERTAELTWQVLVEAANI